MPSWMRIATAVALGVVAAVVVFSIPTSTRALAPSPPVEVQPLVEVDGEDLGELHGTIDLVAAYEYEVTLGQRLYLRWFNDEVTLQQDVHSELSDEQEEQIGRVEIDQSKEVAAAVAWELAGLPVRVTGDAAFVEWVDPDGPAAGRLELGDFVVALNGRPIRTSADLVRGINGVRPGRSVRVGYRRDGVPGDVTIGTRAAEPGSRCARIGISVSTHKLKVELPKEVEVKTGRILGPSAGLAFALTLYDAESSDDLLQGRHVVATGALAQDGSVVPVGAIKQKAIAAQRAGADVLLVPTRNEREAVEAISAICSRSCTQVEAVGSVEQAVNVLLGRRTATLRDPCLAG